MADLPRVTAIQAELTALASHHRAVVPSQQQLTTPSGGSCLDLHRLAVQHQLAAPRRAQVHKLVLANALRRAASQANYYTRDVHAGRLALWGLNTTRLLHLTHIAKSGGRSVKDELSKLMRRVRWLTRGGGGRRCAGQSRR